MGGAVEVDGILLPKDSRSPNSLRAVLVKRNHAHIFGCAGSHQKLYAPAGVVRPINLT